MTTLTNKCGGAVVEILIELFNYHVGQWYSQNSYMIEWVEPNENNFNYKWSSDIYV